MMKEKVLEILSDIRPDLDFETEKDLVSGKKLASFDIISIISELGEAFDIEIGPKYLVAENFDSLEAITALAEKLMD